MLCYIWKAFCMNNDSSDNAWIIENGKIIDSNNAGGVQKVSYKRNTGQVDLLFSYDLDISHVVKIII